MLPRALPSLLAILSTAGCTRWVEEIRTVPIRWDAVFVLDSTRAGGSGSIRFAGAALVYPEA